jgi:hypothetical protein
MAIIFAWRMNILMKISTPFVRCVAQTRKECRCHIFIALLVSFFIAPSFADELVQIKGEDDAAIEARLKQTVGYLASDELQGRGPGTDGIDRAADYIANRMKKIGLKTDLFQGSPYQYFPARAMSYEDQGSIAQTNIFSQFPNLVYEFFVQIGESSPDNQSPKKESSKKASFKTPVKDAGRIFKWKNIVAILEGQGPAADETIVIGAHYDHLGMRKDADGKTLVYHGANDNASGVATMLETAEILGHRQKKLPRRIVFVAFSGEESGLLGSFYYVDHPPLPLDKTIAMINLDVVGRVEADIVMTTGTSTSHALAKMTNNAVERHQLTLIELPGVFSGSDHVAFYAHGIPVVFFLSQGGQGDYHRPSDTADTLNYPGMRKIAQIAADLSVEIAQSDKRPDFAEEGALTTIFRNILRFWSWVFG